MDGFALLGRGIARGWRVVTFRGWGAWGSKAPAEPAEPRLPGFQLVFAMPKHLRRPYYRDRRLLTSLCRSAVVATHTFYQTGLGHDELRVGMVVVPHTSPFFPLRSRIVSTRMSASEEA